jgi:hypothetical protein
MKEKILPFFVPGWKLLLQNSGNCFVAPSEIEKFAFRAIVIKYVFNLANLPCA